MAVINHAKREINAKLVCFGPPDSGKGDLLRYIHRRIKPSLCGPLKNMQAGNDSLLFFDYIPFEASSLNGYRICFHFYTLTGAVHNSGTWKMILKGVDGVAFVAPSTAVAAGGDAGEYLSALRGMLSGYGKELHRVARILLVMGESGAVPSGSSEYFDSGKVVSCNLKTGDGILQALAQLSHEVLLSLRQEFEDSQPVEEAVVHDDALSDDKGQPLIPLTVSAPQETVPVKLELTGGSVVTVPLRLQFGDSAEGYTLRLSLSLEKDSPRQNSI